MLLLMGAVHPLWCGKVLPELQTALIDLGIGELVTVCGRGYMLDQAVITWSELNLHTRL